jgi:hypothetical protein
MTTEEKLHKVLDDLAKIIDSKARDEKSGDFIFSANEWYAMHCLLAFAPERGESQK